MLPRPADFNDYAPHVQDRMMGWNDAWTTDESRRQDKLVDAEIEQSRTGRKIAVGLALFCFTAAVVFFALGNNLAGLAFLAVPVLETATGFLSNVVSRSSSQKTVESTPRVEEPPQAAPQLTDESGRT